MVLTVLHRAGFDRACGVRARSYQVLHTDSELGMKRLTRSHMLLPNNVYALSLFYRRRALRTNIPPLYRKRPVLRRVIAIPLSLRQRPGPYCLRSLALSLTDLPTAIASMSVISPTISKDFTTLEARGGVIGVHGTLRQRRDIRGWRPGCSPGPLLRLRLATATRQTRAENARAFFRPVQNDFVPHGAFFSSSFSPNGAWRYPMGCSRNVMFVEGSVSGVSVGRMVSLWPAITLWLVCY